MEIQKNDAFPKKTSCGPRPVFVNTPSPAALRRQRDATTGHTVREAEQNREMVEAGAPKKNWAHLLILSLTLFEIAR